MDRQYVFLAVLLCTLVFANEGRVYTHSSLAGRAKPEYIAKPAHDLLCRPFGECEPCPKDEVSNLFFISRHVLLVAVPTASAKQTVEAQHHLTDSLTNLSVYPLGIDVYSIVFPRISYTKVEKEEIINNRRGRYLLGRAAGRLFGKKNRVSGSLW